MTLVRKSQGLLETASLSLRIGDNDCVYPTFPKPHHDGTTLGMLLFVGQEVLISSDISQLHCSNLWEFYGGDEFGGLIWLVLICLYAKFAEILLQQSVRSIMFFQTQNYLVFQQAVSLHAWITLNSCLHTSNHRLNMLI